MPITNPSSTPWHPTSTHHILSKPDPPVGSNIDPDADLVQRSTEQVDPVPSSKRLVSHAFLNGIDARPRRRIRSRHSDILPTVTIARKTFISDALVRRHTIRASMAKAAVIHVPAMEKCAINQGSVPGERRQTTGSPIMVDQLEELLAELLGLCGDRSRPIGSRQSPVLCRNQGSIIAESHAVRDGLLGRGRGGSRGRSRGTGNRDVRLRLWHRRH